MRSFATVVRRNLGLTPPSTDRRRETYDSALLQQRLNRSMRRRFTDDLANLIRRACLTGHFDAAEELLAALQHQFEREGTDHPDGRRPDEDAVQALAAEIATARRQLTMKAPA